MQAGIITHRDFAKINDKGAKFIMEMLHWTDVPVTGMDGNIYLHGQRVVLSEDKLCYEPYREEVVSTPEPVAPLQDALEVVPVAA